MHPVEAMSRFDEICGRLRRAADAGHLREAVRFHPELVERLDHVVGDRVVAAPGAQRGGRALVRIARQTDVVDGRAHAGMASDSRSGSVIASAGMGWPS